MAEVTIDHLAADVAHLREADRQLAVDIQGIASGLEGVRTELRLAWRIGAGLLAFLGGALLLVGREAYNLSFSAGALTGEVRSNAVQLEKRMDKLEAGFDKLETKLEARFDKLETKVDQRFGHIDQQLGVILQRLDQVAPKPKP